MLLNDRPFLYVQVANKFQDGLDALESHPAVKRVTPHRKVTRTLKYIKGKWHNDLFIICCSDLSQPRINPKPRLTGSNE